MKKQQWLALISAAAAAVLLLCSCSAGQSSIYDGKDSEQLLPPSYDSNEEVVLPDIPGGETYLQITENPEKSAAETSTVTFSLKVDTASYANVTRYLESGELPPKDAVRTEELLNYFRYEGDMFFTDDVPFSLYTEVGPSPFHPDKRIAMIRVKTPDIDKEALPPCNLTFLIDTSGSMCSAQIGLALGAAASYAAAKDVPFVRIIFCDAEATDAGYMASEDIAGRVEITGRGGTILQPGIDALEKAKDFPPSGPILVITDGYIEDNLKIRRKHAFLIPNGNRLPFRPKGKVFYMENKEPKESY